MLAFAEDHTEKCTSMMTDTVTAIVTLLKDQYKVDPLWHLAIDASSSTDCSQQSSATAPLKPIRMDESDMHGLMWFFFVVSITLLI